MGNQRACERGPRTCSPPHHIIPKGFSGVQDEELGFRSPEPSLAPFLFLSLSLSGFRSGTIPLDWSDTEKMSRNPASGWHARIEKCTNSFFFLSRSPLSRWGVPTGDGGRFVCALNFRGTTPSRHAE